jgi:phosphoserine phosphatase RsbU/P
MKNEPVIICVDDENIVLRSLKRELDDAFGHTYLIETAEDGEETLELFHELRDDEHEIPLVISDYIMPDMKGDELLAQIHEISPQTRKIMLTGQASTEGIGNAVNRASLYRFIAKPWDQNDLILTVTEAVRSYFQEQEIDQKNRELEQLNLELKEYSRTLEHKVTERTQALHETLDKAEEANNKLLESIQYAKLIQRSLLPAQDLVQARMPDSFFLWMPRDIVGGDFFFTEFFEDAFLIGVIDCTGHGVPGAFMTIIASSGLRKIVKDDACRSPADILQRLNFNVKTSLHQHTDQALSDDGLDAAICLVNPAERTLTFAGANLPLYYVHHNQVRKLRGDRQSIGYKRSDLNFEFTNQSLTLEPGMKFYLSSDGLIDQLGGARQRRFGTKQFKQLLLNHNGASFTQQRDVLLHAFQTHKGDGEQQDDVTVIGFTVHGGPTGGMQDAQQSL